MKNVVTRTLLTSFASALLVATSAGAASPEAIVGALRISGTITGGSMPTNSPEFTALVNLVENNDYYGAALAAVQSQYGTKYILRRLAFQMQNSNLQASTVTDNDATAFLMAHFAGVGGVSASISKIWSNNMTCLVRNSAGTLVHVGSLTPVELNTIDWRTALSCSPGQEAIDIVAKAALPSTDTTIPKIAIPIKHVGGYTTLSDRVNDNSFAQISATAGTNLRYIVNLWTIATGMDIMEFISTDARSQQVPKFVPLNDPHFLIGNGQTACIACHGGGLVSLNHGYSTLADLFDFGTLGFNYNKAPTIGTMKSLGSAANRRQQTQTCNLAQFTVCNPDSAGADVNQSWDLGPTWGARGVLSKMGWVGPTSGQGLNALGVAIGKAGVVYANLVKRVIREVCPLGAIPEAEVASISQALQSSDDIKLAVAQIASHTACR